jgi:protein involved in polysaccharide export with SLBB domain
MFIRTGHAASFAAVLFAAMLGGAAASTLAAPTLQVGDRVMVHVYNHPELSGERPIDSDGTIAVPLAGAVEAAGVAPQAAAARITTALRRYLPYVAVEVQRLNEGASIVVAGWPYSISDGVVKYLPGQTLASAIGAIRNGSQNGASAAFDPYHSAINMRSVLLDRGGRQFGAYDMVALNASGNGGPTLRPGDAVRFVSKPVAIRVTGAVKQPGYAYLAQDEPVADAIDQVGGFTENAQSTGLRLRRDGREHAISVADAEYHQPARNGDALDVPSAPQVIVAGIVLHPGPVMLKTDTSLVAAVFSAGGPDKDSDLGQVRVVRNGAVTSYDVTAITHGDFTQNPQLRDGDQVYVPRGRHNADAGIFASILSSLRWTLFRN